MIASSTVMLVELTVVVVPLTVKSPVITASPETDKEKTYLIGALLLHVRPPRKASAGKAIGG